MNRILLVEDKESLGRMILEALEVEGLECEWSRNGADANRRLKSGRRYLAVVTDLRLPGEDGVSVVRHAKESDPDCPVIVMTAYGTVETAVEAMKAGAFDFIQKPFDIDHLILLLRRCGEHRALKLENLLLREDFQRRHHLPAIIGDSELMRGLSHELQKVAATDSTVLLLGESGTGKELFARAIHQLSPRRDRPFVAVNCAAIPETLLENELFGHEKGAYTGATSRHFGRFELADSGTIFLDEISELAIGVQSKILRVLQEKKFERVGGVSTIEVDIRVICATNRDLQAAVREGQFREDLYYRIHVFPIVVPPLRARRTDIDLLTDHFISKQARDLGKQVPQITEAARAALRGYDWPGNIRELENCLERAIILCDHNTIDVNDLNLTRSGSVAEDTLRQYLDLSGTLSEASERAVTVVEKLKITDALSRSGDREEAAAQLGMSVRQLASKIREYKLEST